MAGIVHLEISNWDKFNPRKDLKSTSWLRFQNSIFEDPQFFEFNHTEICFWLYLLCQASKKQSGSIILNFAHAIRIGRFSADSIHSSIKKLKEINCVTESHADVTPSTHENSVDVPLRTNVTGRTERNVTNETQRRDAHVTYGDGENKIQAIPALVEEWGITLKHFNISKDPKFDDSAIASLQQRHGFEKTRFALIGQRYEQKTQNFDPAKHISIARLKSNQTLFEKLVNLGAQDHLASISNGTDYSFLKPKAEL